MERPLQVEGERREVQGPVASALIPDTTCCLQAMLPPESFLCLCLWNAGDFSLSSFWSEMENGEILNQTVTRRTLQEKVLLFFPIRTSR